MTVTALYSLLSIYGIFALLVLLRRYQIDKFRVDLFILRDTLFLEAADGTIPFDHPAYAQLRKTMNGFLRYAHRLTFWHTLLSYMISPELSLKHEEYQNRRWQRVTKGLTEEQVRRLEYYKRKMEVLVFKHLVFLIPECFVAVPILLCILLLMVIRSSSNGNLGGAWERVKDRVGQRVSARSEPLQTVARAHALPANYPY